MSDAKNVTMSDVELEKAEIETAISDEILDEGVPAPEEESPEEEAPEKEETAFEEEKKEVSAKEEKKPPKKEEKKPPAKKEEKKMQNSPYPTEYGEMMKICVPKDKLNPSDDIIPVHINNFSWKIVRGEPAMVPEAVYDMLHAGGYL